MSFSGKTVLITGAAGGIGQACARRFAREGASLVLCDRSLDDSAAISAGLGTDRAVWAACDVSAEADVAAACAQAMTAFGRLDIVVNIAGMMIYKPIAELTADDWHRLLGVNLIGAALFTGQAFRHMKAGSAVVNVASIHAYQTSPLVAPYAAAKAGLASLTRSAAIEGAELGIRVNAVMPGAVDTPMLWASPNLKSGAEKLEPKDVGQPDDIAGAVVYLAGDDARFVTGACLNVDGGRLAKL